MTEVDRDIALVLLKRLWKRELISEETYVSACNSRFFDKRRFTSDTEANVIGKEEQWHEQKTEGISRVSLPHTQSAAGGWASISGFQRKI